MTGPLALVGGDELKPGNEPQDEILVRAAAGAPAYVLATAAGRQRPEIAVANAVRWFGALGLHVEELPALRKRDATSRANVERVVAGRFFYLDAIVTAWRGGAALAGSSAGAMAFGEWTLTRERMPGDERRRYAPALALVPRVAVIPHFDGFGRQWVDSALAGAERNEVILLGIDERTAAVHHDGMWWAVGEGAVTVITQSGRTRFDGGSPIAGLPEPSLAE
jgi:cyanophycinase-like exopeptidase